MRETGGLECGWQAGGVAGDGGGLLRCFAADVVAATLDPLTGRTLAFNHTPIAAWAGHLCDLVLCGALVDSGGVVTAGPVPPGLHPLVHDAFVQLQPALPRAWRWMFAPQVVDTNSSVGDVRRWLVQTGVWTRRRTLFGPRYAETGAPPTPVPPEPSGDRTLRLGVQTTLVRLAKFGSPGSAELRAASMPGHSTPVGAVLVAADDLVAWKAGNPAMPAAGTGGMHGGAGP